jgi:hypothetical protein
MILQAEAERWWFHRPLMAHYLERGIDIANVDVNVTKQTASFKIYWMLNAEALSIHKSLMQLLLLLVQIRILKFVSI